MYIINVVESTHPNNNNNKEKPACRLWFTRVVERASRLCSQHKHKKDHCMQFTLATLYSLYLVRKLFITLSYYAYIVIILMHYFVLNLQIVLIHLFHSNIVTRHYYCILLLHHFLFKYAPMFIFSIQVHVRKLLGACSLLH